MDGIALESAAGTGKVNVITCTLAQTMWPQGNTWMQLILLATRPHASLSLTMTSMPTRRSPTQKAIGRQRKVTRTSSTTQC